VNTAGDVSSSAVGRDVGIVRDGIANPVFVLAPPRSLSSVACAMLGRHPAMYGLPETHLFVGETMQEWWDACARESFQMSHGLLRAVAEICYGEQTDATVELASAWLRRRSSFTSGMVFEELARRVTPRMLVDKSPNMVYSIETMRRAYDFFPEAKFVHLVRHPRAYCESVLTYMRTLARPEYQPSSASPADPRAPGWIVALASYPYTPRGAGADGQALAELDPQGGWFVLNSNIVTFVESLRPDQRITIHGEDLVGDPRRTVMELLTWLGLEAQEEVVARMMHPELSPFARFGPPAARLGNDIFFLERPALRPGRAQSHTLEAPLEWRQDAAGFLSEVVELAQRLGYR
jgi:Sulfotransferase family